MGKGEGLTGEKQSGRGRVGMGKGKGKGWWELGT